MISTIASRTFPSTSNPNSPSSFEFADLGLPTSALSAILGPLRLDSRKWSRLFSEYVPSALKCGGSAKRLITVYWEERWGQDVLTLKREFGLWDPPEARWSKLLREAKNAAAKGQREEAKL